MQTRGARTEDWDMDFYAAALKITTRATAPLVIAGKILSYIVSLVFLVFCGYFIYLMVDHEVPPISFIDVDVLPDHVSPGASFKVKFDIYRLRVCQVEPNWSVFGGDGQKYTFFAQRMDAGGPPGHDPFIREFKLPPDIKPGHGRFRAIWSWICPLNFIDLQFPRTAETKDVPFEIVVKPP